MSYRFETLQVHAGQEAPDSATGSRAVPIYQTSAYVFDNAAHAAARFGLTDAGNIYGRLTNPTQAIFEERMAALEGGSAALAVASGAAAVTYAFLGLAQAGDNIVAAQTIYGGTYNLLAHTLPAYGITARFAQPEAADMERAIDERTRALFVETIGNPNGTLADLAAIAAVARRHRIPLVVDNTFATPFLIRPFEYGADIVVHSASKYIGGHGTAIGGVIVESGRFDWKASGKFPQMTEPTASYHGVCFADAASSAAFVTRLRAVILRDTGATLAPLHAFLFLQGLETLSLRMERHVENALATARFLAAHPAVESVDHPVLSTHPQHALYEQLFPHGGVAVFTFRVRGGAAEAMAFIDRLKLFSLLANVADVKSLVIHPASTTHAQLTPDEQAAAGIFPNTIRLSIGTEHIDDILADLKQALEG